MRAFVYAGNALRAQGNPPAADKQFALARNLRIERSEAARYIKAFFERYAGVRRFIDMMLAKTRETGIARTLFGRERPIPDMNSRNPNARGFA